MNIAETKINGIKNPVGFDCKRVKCSWKVTNAKSKHQTKAKITVASDRKFENIVWEKEGKDLSSIGTSVDMSFQPETRYYYSVEVTGECNETAKSETAFFETGKMDEGWAAYWIGMDKDDQYHPVFTRKFDICKEIAAARIYVSGLGLYEAWLNGHKIGSDYLAPFCTDYHENIQYQTYELMGLCKGENTIEIMAGNGWYKGRLGFEGGHALYGSRFCVIAEIHISYTDGTKDLIITDGAWSYYGSDIAMSDLYDGEQYDHLLWSDKENRIKPAVVFGKPGEKAFDAGCPAGKLVGRNSVPVVVKDELAVKEVIHTPAGETVLDMGQNFAGYLQFKAKLPEGTKITLDFGEILQNGNFYNENYRSAKAQFIYVAGNGKSCCGMEMVEDGYEIVRPHFTWYGFRYVRVSGWPGEIHPEDFTGKVVYSDLDTVIDIHTSDEKLNRLALNCIWGQRSNFLDIPTDCPQRDERLGWTGDAQVFAPTACYNMDTRAFYHKFLNDLRLDQTKNDGVIANYLPNIGSMPSGSSVWGDAATFIPMTLYEHYGDKDALAEYYPMMKDWVDWIIRQEKKNGGNHLWNFGFHFGDWLAQDGVTSQSFKGGTDDYFVASLYYYASLKKVAQAAEILGNHEDNIHYGNEAAKVYQAILAEYFSPNGRLTIDTQTGYLLCLRFHVYISKERIIEGLAQRLKKDCYRLKGGFVGAPVMCRILAENGFEDMAYQILFYKGFPGWMRCIDLGATTIWERWNSVMDDGSMSGTGMNSLNHYSYGSVMEYVYRDIAGIQPAEAGFHSVRFVPQLNHRLKEMKCSYDSVSGIFTSCWKIHEDNTVTVRFEVPFNCSAEAILPGTGGETIMLEAGVFEKTYMPDKDYNLCYSMDSRLEEFRDDERAMDILRKELPAAYGMAMDDDIENLSLSLRDMQYMFFMGFRPDMVQKAADQILRLRG